MITGCPAFSVSVVTSLAVGTSNASVNWPARSRTEPEAGDAITQIHQQVTDLLHGPGTVPSGFADTPRMCT